MNKKHKECESSTTCSIWAHNLSRAQYIVLLKMFSFRIVRKVLRAIPVSNAIPFQRREISEHILSVYVWMFGGFRLRIRKQSSAEGGLKGHETGQQDLPLSLCFPYNQWLAMENHSCKVIPHLLSELLKNLISCGEAPVIYVFFKHELHSHPPKGLIQFRK